MIFIPETIINGQNIHNTQQKIHQNFQHLHGIHVHKKCLEAGILFSFSNET